MKNQAGVKLENQAALYRFRWDSWEAATFGPPTWTSTTTRTATNLRLNLVDQNKILTMAGKCPDRHWRMTECKMSGQLKKPENEQAKLLKTFDGHLVQMKIHLAQNKTVSAERTHQCFFETYNNLEENRTAVESLSRPDQAVKAQQ